MGGNIFKDPPTIRLDAVDYFKLTNNVIEPLKEKFGGDNFYLLPSYRLKENFGDADVLINNVFGDYSQIIEFIKMHNNLSTNDVAKNSHVVSMKIENFQFDFIFCNPLHYETSKNYYKYSDLGNFLGRIAKKLGFKLGHEGLSAIYNYNNYEFANNIISKDIRKILKFIGYNPDTFDAGFDTLEDIYIFASSTLFFNKKIFAFENRNHTARTRDKKRDAYRGFLHWMEHRENLPQYEWTDFSERGNIVIKQEFLERLFEFFPEYEEIHNKTMKDFELWKSFKDIFNGDNISKWTNLSGVELGNFIKHLKNIQQDNFKIFVVENGYDKVKEWTISQHRIYDNEHQKFL
jgi:hypothetical protein